jgi:hypothetical protein
VILAGDRGSLGAKRVPAEIGVMAAIGLACAVGAVALAQVPQFPLAP